MYISFCSGGNEYYSFRCCMGTVESRPETLIDHLRQGLGQPWEHRWRQFLVPALLDLPLKGWLTLGKDLFLEFLLCGAFQYKLKSLDMGECSFSVCLFAISLWCSFQLYFVDCAVENRWLPCRLEGHWLETGEETLSVLTEGCSGAEKCYWVSKGT